MPKYTNRLKHKSHYENVPQGWCGCLLGEICQIQSSKRVHKNDYVEKGVPFYRTTEIKELSEGKTISNCLFISDTQYSLIKQKYGVPHKGDILISAVGTIGITYVIPNEDHFYFKDGNLIWIGKSNSVNSDYLCMMLGHMVRNSNAISTSGSAYNALTIEKLTELEILLPPLTEQNRIIEELNKWYSAIEIIENGEVSLFDTIQNVKSKILNLAIHGILVPQDASDEPASELLKRINPKAIASCDNPHYEQVPFEIPDNWVWVRIDEINKFKSKSVNPQNYPTDQFELYSVPTFETGDPEIPYGKDVASSKVEVEEGDVLLCKINPHLNRVWVVRRRMSQLKSLASSEWIVIRTDEIMPEYLAITMQSPYFRELMMSNVSGVGGSLMRAQPTFVKQYMIPIPPIREQKRIVAKIQETFYMLHSIAESLN